MITYTLVHENTVVADSKVDVYYHQHVAILLQEQMGVDSCLCAVIV